MHWKLTRITDRRKRKYLMKPESKINVVFILTDDQGYWAMGCAGNSELYTPHIDSIAHKGIRFTNFFCASPVCSPARASILTGLMPSQHGIHDWLRRGNMATQAGMPVFKGDDCGIEYLAGIPGFTDYLAKAGYRCGISGKWHLGDSLRPQKGFSYWNVFPYGGSDHYYDPVMIQNGSVHQVKGYLTDIITDGALQFLDQCSGDSRPFYLSVHYTAPHSPWESGQHPIDIVSCYADCPFDTCPDLPCHPWQINSAPRGTGQLRRELLSGYFAAITAMDIGVGKILNKIEEKGIRENTLVIFGSDNGMNMGHHGIWGKGNGTFPLNMFDTSVKVPFLMSLPGTSSQGVIEEGLHSHYDIFPTLLDFLKIDHNPDERMPGKSFASILRGKTDVESEFVVVFDEYGPVRMIRSNQWKYVHRYPYGPNELYDLHNDPGENINRYGDLSLQAITREYRSLMENWFIQYSVPRLDGTRQEVYGKGQLSPIGTKLADMPTFACDWFYIDENGNQTKR